MPDPRSHPDPRRRGPGQLLASFLARLALVAILALAAATVAYAALWLLAWATSWHFIAGIAAGVGLTKLATRHTIDRRTRHLRELLDWIGEDLEVRKGAQLREALRGWGLP